MNNADKNQSGFGLVLIIPIVTILIIATLGLYLYRNINKNDTSTKPVGNETITAVDWDGLPDKVKALYAQHIKELDIASVSTTNKYCQDSIAQDKTYLSCGVFLSDTILLPDSAVATAKCKRLSTKLWSQYFRVATDCMKGTNNEGKESLALGAGENSNFEGINCKAVFAHILYEDMIRRLSYSLVCEGDATSVPDGYSKT
jgi:hypothetical protein